MTAKLRTTTGSAGQRHLRIDEDTVLGFKLQVAEGAGDQLQAVIDDGSRAAGQAEINSGKAFKAGRFSTY